MIDARMAALLFLGILCGCATGSVSLGPTLLSGLKQYEGDMQTIGNSGARWPERQRAGGALKTIITGTLGGSREFYRLVDLDVKRREYLIAMRETSLRPDRMQEMKDELVKMNEEVSGLTPVIKAQMAALPVPQDGQRIEGIATTGLLSLAVDSFSSANSTSGMNAPSTNVNQYVVTDLGIFSTVRSPDGQAYRCSLYVVADEGAGIKCEPVK